MQENRAFHFYPTLSPTPQRIRFPSAHADADAAVVSMSRYMTAEYVLIVELVRDASHARRALAAVLASSIPPPAPSASTNPPPDGSA